MSIKLAKNLFKKTDFSHCQKLILGVSGGSDSLALLFLVKEHLKTLPIAPEVIVVTIDHQLREESAYEAENVAKICYAFQIKHIIVRWEGKKPQTKISEKARIARYDLLFKEAQKQGATLIMTGHTLNDQAETYQMRVQRSQKKTEAARHETSEMPWKDREKDKAPANEEMEISKENSHKRLVQKDEERYERGLSCMPREALLYGKVRLIRPLLGVRRKTLRAYLSLRGSTWIDDPTNEDLKFERVRVRHFLHQKKLTEIAQKVHKATVQRRVQAQKVADLILALDITVEYGHCFIGKPPSFLQQHHAFPFVVGLFIVLMGGSSYLLSSQKLAALDQKLCLHDLEKKRFTLAGAVIEYSRKGLAIWREARHIQKATIAPGETFIWDQRYQIINHDTTAICVGPADLLHLKDYLNQGKGDLEAPHFPSLQSLVMISNEKGVDIPELTYHFYCRRNIIIKRIMAPFHWLVSQEDAPIVDVVGSFFNFN
ncbi:tRNA lysidine(34) synthetase TilS [Bartonella sp. AR 15-3]|uniref:tRNA lysidine(34) synthetase TilS n=1 Tax=Bartonella sp. AR 15-3 TaxID=545617 RepID=UPI0001F4BA34|nr:tRNA lysidine(34) synthetase TilS [Bartonella sp. AR 15-3]OPB32224.1 tRNA(Ile)-lysidine synthase [Bartonella sp. AR 15-3]CBI79880.1 tRNA(Ile)-lysidine synthase [Bartonella sp. AR 15-3]